MIFRSYLQLWAAVRSTHQASTCWHEWNLVLQFAWSVQYASHCHCLSVFSLLSGMLLQKKNVHLLRLATHQKILKSNPISQNTGHHRQQDDSRRHFFWRHDLPPLISKFDPADLEICMICVIKCDFGGLVFDKGVKEGNKSLAWSAVRLHCIQLLLFFYWLTRDLHWGRLMGTW